MKMKLNEREREKNKQIQTSKYCADILLLLAIDKFYILCQREAFEIL